MSHLKVSWQDLSEFKHFLQNLRNRLIDGKPSPIHINTAIEAIDKFILKLEEEKNV